MYTTHDTGRGPRIAMVLGSVRPGSLTRLALEAVRGGLVEEGAGCIDFIDPARLRLAFPGAPDAPALEKLLVQRINAASGVLLATPEYNGSYSSTLKVLIDNMGYPSAMAGKTVALLGVASGALGAIKALEHLRGVCAHAGAMVLPYPVSLAQADTLFDEEGACVHEETARQLRALAARLMAALRQEGPSRFSLDAELPADSGL